MTKINPSSLASRSVIFRYTSSLVARYSVSEIKMIRATPSVMAGKRKWNPMVKANCRRARSNASIASSVIVVESRI